MATTPSPAVTAALSMAATASAKQSRDALAQPQPLLGGAAASASLMIGSKPAGAIAVPGVAAAFQLIVTGQIESIAYPGVGNLYCRYAVTYGNDWRVVHGSDAGLTQLAHRSSQDDAIVFNFPIDMSFKSTNPFGWPRIVFSVYGLDGLGRDIVRGYGSTHIPTTSGVSTRYVALFRPLSSSLMQQFTAWLTGSSPEYFDAKFITQNDGREVTRVTSAGKIKVTLNVVNSGTRQHGYRSDPAYA